MRRLSPILTLLTGLLMVTLTASASHAQERPAQGSLYVYEDTGGEQVVSTTPLASHRLVEVITPVPAPVHVGTSAVQAPSHAGWLERAARIAPLVTPLALGEGLDPLLILALIRAESDFNPRAVSHAGAMGLMQLMPSTARRYGVSDPFDPAQNVRGGCALLARLLERHDGALDLALAAYSAGEVHVARAGGVPSFSLPYIQRVLRAYHTLEGSRAALLTPHSP